MDKATLLHEIRYAERLCQRTARLYRHLSAAATFVTVLGGSGVVAAVATTLPAWVPVTGALLLASAGALKLAIRPEDKAAVADADGKRYAQLRSAAHPMTDAELQIALNKVREGDTAEVESLREVAYNDMVLEMGRGDAVVPLRPHQKLLRAIA